MTGEPTHPERALRVVLLCDDEPFEIPSAVERIVRALPRWAFTVVSLPGHASFKETKVNLRRYLGLYGPFGFAVRAFQMLALKTAARLGLPAGRPHSLRQAASRSGAEFASLDRINSPAGRAFLENLAPDVIVSIACPQILRRKVLAIPRICALNLHSALLPDNRGMLPTFWSLAADPPRAGVTLHLMTPELDGGEILLQREIPVSREEVSLHDLIHQAKRTGADLVVEGLRIVAEGGFRTLPNPPDRGSRNGFPTRRDVIAFRRKGGRIW